MVARSLEPEGRPSRTADISLSTVAGRQLAPPPFGAQPFDEGEIPMGLDEVI
jgi:hypothetical protein